MKQTIEIIIAPDGQSRIESHGFTGNDCRTASRFLEQALGKSTSEQLKPEFHQSPSEEKHLQEGR
ncbi:hypothetical protein Pan153_53450 [Gimesia panareensis]|uniref:DUF2997 domain-containing protein n=1 Tax=Gimesia panareensis TaxID=2527978 RepID=A0A518FWE0_9PLAN|nr:DUF2997 domain-containing protein [Gimesia panareensis]QDV20669.1 hypothetical protein Pan153_53450 [Gimesia panareensis]